MIDILSCGKALFELASEEGVDEEISSELDVILKIFGNCPEVIDLLDTPALTISEKLSVIDDAFSDFNVYVKNFLKILCEEHSVYLFAKCVSCFNEQRDISKRILRADIVTAKAVSDTQLKAISKRLSKKTGKQVVLTNKIDPELIGGALLRYSGVQIDGSIKSRLEELRRSLSETIV